MELDAIPKSLYKWFRSRHLGRSSVVDVATAEKCDVVMLGASREGLLQQVIQGNIPEAIALGVNSTVILVRSID